jgi:hypothetical protein
MMLILMMMMITIMTTVMVTLRVIIYVELECVNDNYDDKVMIIINDPDYFIILLDCILFHYS